MGSERHRVEICSNQSQARLTLKIVTVVSLFLMFRNLLDSQHVRYLTAVQGIKGFPFHCATLRKYVQFNDINFSQRAFL